MVLERVGTTNGFAELGEELLAQVGQQLEIQARYSGYIERQAGEIDQQRRQAALSLPENIDYTQVSGLSNEVRSKLERIRPMSIGQAGRISGMTPAAISLLLIHLKKRKIKRSA